ncbi:C39 family peptidase [Candidatus Parcubacteria bacterium]|nr:C39 family peptidase [Candidatus Parcubacteria bacterium]
MKKIVKINKDIPFYSNPDNTHCYQACFKIVMKYFFPNEDYSFKELDEITAKIKGLWTWPMAGLIWLAERGVKIKVIELFSYKKFIRFGGQYLINEFGEEVGKSQIKHSNIEQEKKFAKNFISIIDIKKKIPVINNIKSLLVQNYIIIVNVNAKKLNNRDGYAGHFIVIKGFDDKNFYVNDPSSQHKNLLVKFNLFEKAWAYPNEKAKNIIALKLKHK